MNSCLPTTICWAKSLEGLAPQGLKTINISRKGLRHMLSFRRADRLGEILQKEISDILRRQVRDPRIGDFCTIMKVDVSDDLRHTKVSVSIMGDENQQKKALEGLKSATPFIRREIGRRIELKFTPNITFVLDRSVDYSFRIDQLIKEFQDRKS